MKCEDFKILQSIKSNMDDNSGKTEEIGRPLFVRVHDHQEHSLLTASGRDRVEFRGLINLLTLLLISYNLQSVLLSLETHGFVLHDVWEGIQKSQIDSWQDPESWKPYLAIASLLLFQVISFWIEIIASGGVSERVVLLLISLNLALNAAFPIAVSLYINCHVIHYCYITICSTSQCLKLVSFHHVYRDIRRFVRQFRDADPNNLDQLLSQVEVPKDILNDALDYPYNLRFSHFVRFFWAPTLCYQLSYPSTPRFRKGFFLKRSFEFLVCQNLILYIIYQHLIPLCAETY